MATPAEGELYRHFKGGLYRIVTIAQHTDDLEGLVIYRSEDDPSKVWARPVVNFMSPVDKVKYPDAVQEMRFEKVEEGTAKAASAAGYRSSKPKSSAERLHILASLNHRLTDEMLITMATAVDVELPEGDVRTKYLSLRESLLILGKYEGDRLR